MGLMICELRSEIIYSNFPKITFLGRTFDSSLNCLSCFDHDGFDDRTDFQIRPTAHVLVHALHVALSAMWFLLRLGLLAAGIITITCSEFEPEFTSNEHRKALTLIRKSAFARSNQATPGLLARLDDPDFREMLQRCGASMIVGRADAAAPVGNNQ